MDYFFKFGKHNGESLKSVMALDFPYIEWILDQALSPDKKLIEAQVEILKSKDFKKAKAYAGNRNVSSNAFLQAKNHGRKKAV